MELAGTKPLNDEVEERLPWHAPEVQRLVVTLDTKLRLGSDVDGDQGSIIVGT